MGIGPRGGGGTASLQVGTHCQTTAPDFRHCPPLNFFYRPLFLGVIDHRPPKLNILNPKLSTNVIQSLLNSCLYKECHVSNKIEGIQT